MKAWYLIQSKPRQEKTAKFQLERQGYETYLPLAHIRKRKRGRMTRVVAPMFPRYLFTHLSDDTDDWGPIRSTIGVSTLVQFGTIPAKVSDELLSALRNNEDDMGVQIQARKEYMVGDKVRISEGVFEGYEAIIYAKSSKERVVLLMKMIENYIKVELDPEHMEPVVD